MKRIISKSIFFLIRKISKYEIAIKLIDGVVYQILKINRTVKHKNSELTFSTPNFLNYYRAKTFSEKEPETLDWIDEFDENSILWDIGANIGLYSCYAAKINNCNVYAFEPSVFNLEMLAKNINLNSLVNKISIIPLPLSNKVGFNNLNMTTISWGGAISSFGESYGPDGSHLKSIFEYSILGITMDYAHKSLKIPLPNYIKIDVDGIEHLILLGGEEILANVKSILIEVDDSFNKQVQHTNQLLSNAGLVLKHKKRSIAFENTSVYNQVWIRE
jgi:FkbM family methyltransferase